VWTIVQGQTINVDDDDNPAKTVQHEHEVSNHNWVERTYAFSTIESEITDFKCWKGNKSKKRISDSDEKS
jgi:hypothetical protein